jgi:hypothetical protein
MKNLLETSEDPGQQGRYFGYSNQTNPLVSTCSTQTEERQGDDRRSRKGMFNQSQALHLHVTDPLRMYRMLLSLFAASCVFRKVMHRYSHSS